MALEIKHEFQSAKGDGPDATLVQPSDWNALHEMNMEQGLIGNNELSVGPAKVIPLGPGLVFNTDGKLEASLKSLPVGIVLPLAGNYEPPGWLICDGREVSRTTYSVLFSIAQTKFGPGDGVTTFNIPDMRGRVPAGKDNLGGTAANRLTSATITGGATDVGKVGGTERHILTVNQLAAHSHHPVVADHWHYIGTTVDAATSSPTTLTKDYAIARSNNGAGDLGYKLHGYDEIPSVGYSSYPEYNEGENAVEIDDTGLNEPHLNLPPMITMNYVIWTGVFP